ncbi:MAG: ERF family protein [Altererythrobacter ishigakiensis]|nr:ERF family protein [Altererythrobacter ishigakiensis]
MTEVTKIEQRQVATEMRAPDPMTQMIERVVMNPDLPMERVQAMFDLRERQMSKEAEQSFNEAFAAAMAEMPDVPRTGENKHLKRKYSTLDDLIRTARPVLARHGLSLNWQTGIEGQEVWVRVVVRHAMGHSIETTDTAPRDKSGSMNFIQGGGSTQSYLKRYTGFAILGLSSGDEVDDDGSSAGSGESISEAQYHELRELMEGAQVSEEVVCTAERIQQLPELPAAAFDRVTKRLRLTIQQKGGE